MQSGRDGQLAIKAALIHFFLSLSRDVLTSYLKVSTIPQPPELPRLFPPEKLGADSSQLKQRPGYHVPPAANHGPPFSGFKS